MSTAYQLVTFNATAGLKEDVLDVIQQISPEDTPILSRLKVKTAYSRLHEWLSDTLQSGTGTGYAVNEGASATFGALAAKTRTYNRTTIMQKVFSISGTMEASPAYGLDSEYAYQLEKAMKELKLMQEQSIIHMTSAAGVGCASGAVSGRQFTGLLACVNSTHVRTGSAGVCALTESEFNAMMQTMAESGTRPDIAYCAGFNKRRISSFATNNTRYQDVGSEGRVRNFVSVYEGDFGTVEVVFDRYMIAGTVALMEQEKFGIAYLQNRRPKVVPLAVVGDSKDAMIVTEYTFEYLNANALGLLSAYASA